MGQDFGTWLLLALGLATVGLLPVKTRGGSLGVSLILSLLWSWLAVAAALNSPGSDISLWTFLAVLQAVVFLVCGVLNNQIRFDARNGFWAVLGAALVLYSLVVFPLLDRFEPFKDSVFGAPFPIVLFTCAVLFFAVDGVASFALVVPLVWALAGGPEGTNPSELWSLRAVLVAGAWFALLSPELRGGGERRRCPGAEYQFAYKKRAAFGYGLWLLILGTLLAVFSFEGRLSDDTWRGRCTINLILLTSLGLGLWLVFPAWQSLWFRYVAWRGVRAGSRFLGWLRDAWKWAFFLLAAVSLVAWLDLREGNKTQSENETESTASQGEMGAARVGLISSTILDLARRPRDRELGTLLLRVVSAVFLLWLIQLVYRARRRLVIGKFDNYTGEEGLKEWAAGIGPHLQNELARIANLYKVIDEARPSQKSAVIEVTPGVQDVGEILKQTSSGSIDLGFIKIPANFFLEMVGRLVSGPRLTGALYKAESEFILTAELSGGGLSGNWRVDFSKLTEEERKLSEKEVVYKLIENLSFRVATQLVSIGSPRWQAVRCFTEGLRFYRETQRQKKDKSRNLREAERCFIRALNDDNKFAQCHYNLGVVYRQLGELGSAESAFRQALVEAPDNYEAYYAVAETFVEGRKYAKAVWFCEAAIAVDPGDPRAWDLKAFAERRYRQAFLDPAGTKNLPSDDQAWEKILEMREIAVALAWRDLCGKELRGSSSMAEKDTAFLCTRNLAVVLTRTKRNPESSRLIQQAAWLTPHSADLRLNEGRNLFWKEKDSTSTVEPLEEARGVLHGVFDDGLPVRDRGFLWSTVAHLLTQTAEDDVAHREAARLAQNRFLDLAGKSTAKELGELINYGLESPPARKSEENHP